MLTPGTILASKYRLEIMFAKGGMGSVWRARHLLLDTDLAIKLMDPAIATSPPERARFAAEAKAAAKLKSRNIVQVLDYGVEGDIPYIVMELLEGEDLGARLRREGRLSMQAASQLLEQLGRGLRRAHEGGVVHRDLKPANVFLARVEGVEEVKILDFGIARFATKSNTTEMTRTGTLLGSPPYMSPEQVRGLKELDHRTDLWSIGVLLFRCLTGTLPFQSEEIGDLIYRICVEPTPAASQLYPGLPPSLDRFFERALAKDPRMRFASIDELTGAFSAACGLTNRAPLPSIPEAAPSADPFQTALAPSSMLGHAATVNPYSADGASLSSGRADPGATVPLSAPLHGMFSSPGIPSTSSLQGKGMQIAAPSAAALQSTPRFGTGTQIAAPHENALAANPGFAPNPAHTHNPALTPNPVPAPMAAGILPLPDPGTLSSGGRTVRSSSPRGAGQGLWWKMGLFGGAALVAVGVIVASLRQGSSPSQSGSPAEVPTGVTLVANPPDSASSIPSSVAPVATLTADPAPSAVASQAPDPSTTAEDPAAPTATLTGKKEELKGKLTINSIPVGKVLLDGRPIGPTPIVNYSVPAGTYRVVIINTSTNVRYTEVKKVAPGGSEKVVHRF